MKNPRHSFQESRAFSLVELLVVIAVIAIIAAIAIPNIANITTQSELAKNARNAQSMASVAAAAKAAGYAGDLSTVAAASLALGSGGVQVTNANGVVTTFAFEIYGSNNLSGALTQLVDNPNTNGAIIYTPDIGTSTN